MSPERWSSRTGFVFAAMGSAVGLGSIWKFPYEVGTNGGGGFVLFYLVGLLLIVFPLMLVELAIGRRGRSDAVGSIVAVAIASGASRIWAVVGIAGVVGAILILSFYSVIGGWAAAYVVDTIRNGLPGASAPAVQARFDALLASPAHMTIYHTLFVAVTALVVARGIARGIERAALYLMPILIVLIVVLAIYSTAQGDAAAALRFLFAFDLDLLSPRVALEALGLGFFSIGVGLAVMITYAAYAGSDFDLPLRSSRS
ncbi:MAG: sodium-dependent transporter [Candidatus Rokuibacteriota bacterium]